MYHFNLLAAKYSIDEEIQIEGIFSSEEFPEWFSEYYKQMQSKEKMLFLQ
jgi:hypothetical protein